MNDKYDDPRPLDGYVVLLGTYSLVAATAVALLQGRRDEVRRITLRDLILLAIATQHLSRLIAKDSITAPVRSPFTKFVKATGEGEVEEEVVGKGLRHAAGELISCPYCLGQWVATGLLAITIAAPNFASALATTCAIARVSDYLQLAYDRVKGDG